MSRQPRSKLPKTHFPPVDHALKASMLQADQGLRIAAAAVGAARVFAEHPADAAAWEEFWSIAEGARNRLQGLQSSWVDDWFGWFSYARQIEGASTLSKLSARELNILNQAAELVSEQSVSLMSLCENIQVDVLHWMLARSSQPQQPPPPTPAQASSAVATATVA